MISGWVDKEKHRRRSDTGTNREKNRGLNWKTDKLGDKIIIYWGEAATLWMEEAERERHIQRKGYGKRE